MYPGQGCQYFHMCKTLFAHDTVFRDSLKRLDRWVQAEIGGSIIDYVFNEQVSALIPFDATLYSNQAVFCFEYALTQSLLSRGVYPDVLLGASLGEVVSAAVSGALSPKECIGLLAVSARVLAQTCEPGGMLSVFAPPSLFDEDRLLHENCEIASVSFDRHFVVAAERSRIEQVEAHLKAGNHITSRLPVEYGFHSSAIDPARSALREHYGNSTPGHPLVPVFSCQKKAMIRAYEVDHFDAVLREPIYFKETLAILELQGPNLYVDVSPSGTLSTYCKYILHPDSKSRTVPVYTPFSKHGTLDPALWLL
ncbi:acyltransferase domain-containing protein [Pseudomonas sp. 681]|uniref:Acyltransferase domain-containing protein n=3 Tax=Pseudomonas TaxID=286 RepID=A0ABT6QIH8_9PSED|nr:acyltransferase domain-containing protein [Pseudomonas sp. 681]MDI2590638.1 acyltransferase domain-containing protein [Pseudomonas sp. 681]